MMKKRNIFYFTFLVCFLFILSSCEAEKEFIDNANEGKNLKRQITFGQFKNEIGQPRFSKRFSLASNANARGISDFEVDTTLVKSLESNYIVYSMNLEPKFEVTDDKFYNLVVYKDYSNEVVKQIVEYSPQNAIFPANDFATSNFLQSTATEVIYSSRSTAEPICTELVIVDRCNCDNHPVSICGGCNKGFTSSTELVIVPCSTGGGTEPDPLPDPYYPDETGDTGGGNDGAVSVDPVIPTKNKDNCNDLKSKSLNQDFKDKMDELKNDANGDVETAFLTFANNPKYSTKYSATPQDPSSIQMPLPSRTDCTGYMHCHLNNPAKKNFAIFSPDDFIAHDTLVGTSTNQQLVKNSMFLINEIKGTTNIYAIKITNKAKFDLMASQLEAFYGFYGRKWEEKIKYNESPVNQVNQFLKFMKEKGWDDCFELYQSDANYQNWEQLTLNSSNNTIKIKC